MRRDGISQQDVERCLANPEESEESVSGRTNYITRSGDGWLRVTALLEDGDSLSLRLRDGGTGRVRMKITYDHEADALYIQLRGGGSVDSRDIEDGVVADLGEDGRIVGFEVLDASKRLTPE
jgi:uncharacterized protein YuzE